MLNDYPDRVPRSGAEALLAGLDPEQREVATALSGPVAVIAGAGTGKTRAITHRIAYGIASGAYNPSTVLAVTFTNRAAGELRGRLRSLGVPTVQARTFHSAALRQAAYFWPRAYDTVLPDLVENKMSLVAEAAARLRLRPDTGQLRDLVSEISWAKVSNVVDEQYAAIARRDNREVSGLDPEAVSRVFARYEDLKRDRHRIDFDDILLCTASLLADRDDIAEEIRRTYRHLVVDEYQDVSPLQQAVLELWRGEREEVCVVGDPAQTIHSFAGARSDYLTGFARRHRAARVIRLVRDYRSTPQVVAAANTVIHASSAQERADPAHGARHAVTLIAQRPDGPAPVFQGATDEPAEATGVAEWLAGLAARGVAYREMAVLFRVNSQSPPIEQALSERGIPYLVRGGERFYERAEVGRALGALRAAARNADASPSAEVSPSGDASPSTGAFADDAAAQAERALAEAGWTPEAPSGAGAVRERWESLSALRTAIGDLIAERPDAGLAEVVGELEARAAAQQVPEADGVTVSTLHSAKGLEWDAVAMVGVHEGMLPFVLATRAAQVVEERRLCYVGMTRAREHLRVSWAATRNGGGGQRRASRFLDGLIPASAAAPVKPRREKSAKAATCRVCARPISEATDRKLGRHEGCPSSYDEATLEALRTWRRDVAKAASLPAYCVFTDATMTAIAEARPASASALLKVPGLGRAKLDKYGEEVLSILRDAGSGAR